MERARRRRLGGCGRPRAAPLSPALPDATAHAGDSPLIPPARPSGGGSGRGSGRPPRRRRRRTPSTRMDAKKKKSQRQKSASGLDFWSREEDLNLRPPGYEPGELPDCSIPQYMLFTCFSVPVNLALCRVMSPASYQTAPPRRVWAHQLRRTTTICPGPTKVK